MEQNNPEQTVGGAPQGGSVLGRGMIAGIVAVVVIAALCAVFFLGSSGSSAGGAVVPPQTCAGQAVAYVNANLAQAGYTAELKSVEETGGVYRIMVLYQGSEIPVYATRDCTLLFTNAYTISAAQAGSAPSYAAATTVAPAEPVRSDRPAVDLYAMAFCPYGVQVENVMKPVVDLFGDSIDMDVRYIATVPGDTVATAQSLHGTSEAVEDVRQLCIAEHAPGKLWEYIAAFNARCYPSWSNAEKLSECQANVTAALSLPAATIDACAAGSEGLSLLKADEALAAEDRATGSPTLLINGQKYTGARTAEAIKQAICEHFTVAPQACDTVLSTQSAAASGSC